MMWQSQKLLELAFIYALMKTELDYLYFSGKLLHIMSLMHQMGHLDNSCLMNVFEDSASKVFKLSFYSMLWVRIVFYLEWGNQHFLLKK